MLSPKSGLNMSGCGMPLLPPPCHRAPCRSATHALARSGHTLYALHRHSTVGSVGSSCERQPAPLFAGVLMPAALQISVASPARADDPILAASGSAATPAAGAQAEAAAAADSVSSSLITLTNAAPDDPVITVLFYFAITVLSVVTLGVAYLALTGWLDDRKEKEDRKAFESAEAQRQVAQDREKAASVRKPPRRRTAGSGKGGGKGFS